MYSKQARVSILILALVLGGCTTQAGGTASPAPSRVAVAPTANPTAAALATPSNSSGGASATPSSIDPCTLLTTQEASTLMGVQLGAGVSSTVDANRVCTFKSGVTEVKLILAPPAPDSTTAQNYWDEARAQVPADITVTDLTLFDRSAYGTFSASGQSLSALFVIKGLQFFDLYCGFPACTQDASVTAAQLIGGRLP